MDKNVVQKVIFLMYTLEPLELFLLLSITNS